MGNFVQGKDPTPHKELIEKLMDPAIPKTESEWAAKKEIAALHAEIELKKDLIQMSLDHIYRYGVALDVDKLCSLLEKALSTKEDLE